MNDMEIKELREGRLSIALKLAEEFDMVTDGEGKLCGLGAWIDGRLVGVCLGRVGRTMHSSELMFVHVNGLYRGQGIARRLVEAWKLCLRHAGVDNLATEYIVGNGQPSPRPFLEAVGFSNLRQGETLVSMRLDVLAASEWAKEPEKKEPGLHRLSDLTPSDLSSVDNAMRRHFPSFATLQSVRGELLGDLSWVFLDENGDVKISLLFSEEEGNLYLHSLYCATGWQRHLPELLRLALSSACARSDHYERIYVTCINEASYQIVKRIVQGLPHQERTAWRMYMKL